MDAHTKGLAAVQKALKTKKPRAVPAIAKAAKCNKTTVYRRIEALRKRGAIIAETMDKRSVTGPTRTLYVLVQEANL